ARVREVRATRHAATTSATLARVGQAARDGENLMPHLLAAVEAMATVGEIADALRDVFGEYREAS
ncbi:MAG: methylmalonyl-CoA mutase family protein, partial [Acidobacteriota bacterium]